MGEYREAESWSKKAVNMLDDLFEGEHLFKAGAHLNYGRALNRIGQTDDALKHAMGGYDQLSKILSNEHIYYGKALVILSEIHAGMKAQSRAAEYLEQAIPIYEKHYGIDHKETRTLQQQLSVLGF